MSPTAQAHIHQMKHMLNSPPAEASFWDRSSRGERRYMLMSVEHPAGRVADDSARDWLALDDATKSAVGRAYRKVMGWAQSVARRGAIVNV
ncbi:MAG: hypothetical protein PF501_14745 [Salinisphaera sp.]|jgi:hypothetical protein|nr:hypothetical protein [Salinisphaera sp.]